MSDIGDGDRSLLQKKRTFSETFENESMRGTTLEQTKRDERLQYKQRGIISDLYKNVHSHILV